MPTFFLFVYAYPIDFFGPFSLSLFPQGNQNLPTQAIKDEIYALDLLDLLMVFNAFLFNFWKLIFSGMLGLAHVNSQGILKRCISLKEKITGLQKVRGNITFLICRNKTVESLNLASLYKFTWFILYYISLILKTKYLAGGQIKLLPYWQSFSSILIGESYFLKYTHAHNSYASYQVN